MHIVSIKIKDGGVAVKWTQEAGDGILATWQCNKAVRPQDALATAMAAVVPHVAASLGLDAATAEKCAFSSMTISERENRKTHETETYVQIILALPSPQTDKPAAAKTDKLLHEVLPPQFGYAVDDLIQAANDYAGLCIKAVSATAA